MKRVKHLIILLWIIIKKKPIITPLVLIGPLVSSLLGVYTYSASVSLIDLIATKIGTSSILELFKAVAIPLAMYLSVNIIQYVIGLINRIFTKKLTTAISWILRSEIIDIVNTVPYIMCNDKEFYNRLERAKAVAEDDVVGSIESFISIINTFGSFLSLVLLLINNGLYLISMFVLAMFIVNLSIKLSTEIKVRKLGRQLTFNGRVADYLSGLMSNSAPIREMRIFHCLDYFLDIWSKNIVHQHKERYSARRFEIKMGIVVSIIQTSTTLWILIMLIKQIQISSNITIGLLSVLFLGLIQSKNKIIEILWPLCNLYLVGAKVHDLNEILQLKDMIHIDENTNVRGRPVPVQMKSVSFSYGKNGNIVLSDVSLTINPGEKIAIVGPNGAGKSTLIKLILGLYQPEQGEVTWNGNRIKPSNISAVFQNFNKYELTLRENIGLGNMNKMDEDEEMIRILEKCGLMDLYEELGSLDKPLGYALEGGRDISGGQWQRLAIARALYRDSDLIIFDEPTAAIDPQSELKLYEMLMQLCRDKTAIFVSHRLGWAKKSDRILVINDNRITEDGTHEELMALRGYYYQMYNLQSSWYLNEK